MVEINTKKEGDILLMDVKGEVDVGSSIQLDNAFKEAIESDKKIALNLSALEYISSAGLGVFVSHLEEIGSKNIKFILFGLIESVQQTFELLGLQELLDIVSTKEEAIKKLN